VRAAPAAIAAPALVTGGHPPAQAPEQADWEPLSASNMYTVIFFGPAARIVPSLLLLLATARPAALAPVDGAAAAVLLGCAYLEPPALTLPAPVDLLFDDDE
jgi:hypothetical protein